MSTDREHGTEVTILGQVGTLRVGGSPTWVGPVTTPPPLRHSPESLEAIFDQIADLVIEWHEADRYADNAPASEREDARGLAEERKDTVLQFLAQVMTS